MATPAPALSEGPRDCPLCGHPMERGYLIAQPAMNYLPCTIGWLDSSHPPTGRGIRDQAFGQPLVQIGIWSWTPIPRFPAWRCVTCRRAELTWGDAILKVAPENEPNSVTEVRHGSDFA